MGDFLGQNHQVGAGAGDPDIGRDATFVDGLAGTLPTDAANTGYKHRIEAFTDDAPAMG